MDVQIIKDDIKVFYRGDAFDKDYSSFLGITPYSSTQTPTNVFVDILREKKYSVRFTDTTYRILNNWADLSIIDDFRNKSSGWKKFSLIDLMWIEIIGSLREFGLSINAIKIAQHWLFDLTKFDKYLFDYYVAHVLERVPVSIIVKVDGQAYLGSEEEIYFNREMLRWHNFIHIDFNQIVIGVLGKDQLQPVFKNLQQLTANELEIIQLLRSKKYESIEIKLKNGQIERYTGKENVDTNKRIKDLLNENDFQEISIIKHEGQIVAIKRAIKYKT